MKKKALFLLISVLTISGCSNKISDNNSSSNNSAATILEDKSESGTAVVSSDFSKSESSVSCSSENSSETKKTAAENLENFLAAANGIWVDLSSCNPISENAASFLFVSVENGKMYSANSHSETGLIADVYAVSPEDDLTYSITLHYPECDYMGEHFNEQFVNIAVRLKDGNMFLDGDDFTAPYFYMGKNLEEAEREVLKYLKSANQR